MDRCPVLPSVSELNSLFFVLNTSTKIPSSETQQNLLLRALISNDQY